MSTTAGAKAAGKRSWQGTERPTFDEHSHKVWRGIITVLALALIGAALYYLYLMSLTPPKALLVSITDDRSEYATVPPVPMMPGDERALLDWARAARVPTLRAALDKDFDGFVDRMTSSDPLRSKFTILDEAGNSASGLNLTVAKNDTLIFYLRGHGMAAQTSAGAPPQPFLVTNFDGFKELSDDNSIPVAKILKRLAAIPQVKKLVILDVVHFNYDPRFGQLVNQFPEAVANAIPADAENLWVILPTGTGELTAVVPHYERTVFNVALTDCLQAALYNEAKHAPLSELVKNLSSKYHEVLNSQVDLDYWQTLTVLPSPEAPKVKERFARESAGILIPTIPSPKKPPAGKTPAATPEKKTVQSGKSGSFGGSLPLTLAAYQPPAGTPANPGTPAAAPATAPMTVPAADAKSSANPPATGPMNPTVPAPAPTTTPKPTPPAAPDPEAEQPFAVSIGSYRQKLTYAWQLRDAIEDWEAEGRSSWSPVHFAAPLWRHMNARLVSHEERCRAGDLGASERDLDDVIKYLKRLHDALREDRPAGGWDSDRNYGLTAAWQRFRFGDNKVPSRAWESFKASDRNSLLPANRALKSYADCAYRLPEYVRLQGLLLGAPGVSFDLDADIKSLIVQLRTLRNEFTTLPTGSLIDPLKARDLASKVQSLERIRKFMDSKVRDKALELAQAQSLASPGRMQAICLMLESPLLRAADRTILLERVLPPLKGTQLNTSPLVGRVRTATGVQVFGNLGPQVDLEIRCIEFFSGSWQSRSAQADTTILDRSTSCITNLRELTGPGSDKRVNALAIGAEFRKFLTQLPEQIITQENAENPKSERLVMRKTFDLYHWLLLVDARDAREVGDSKIFLMQPFFPEPVDDLVKLTLTPENIQLTDVPQEVKVSVELITDKTNLKDLQARLSLQFKSDLLTVVDADQESALLVERTIQLPGKTWEGRFKVSSKVTGDQEAIPLTAVVKFGPPGGKQATASQTAEVRVPRPNLIDIKVVAEHRFEESDPLANAETERDQGAELRVFPNRNTALRILLRNMSSADKKVRVQLINPIPSERKRLYEEGGTLAEEYQRLERLLLSQREGLPLNLANRVVAATPEKTPVLLKSTGSPPVTIPLEVMQPPANGAGTPALDLDVTGGLICLITNLDNPAERFVKWLDLRPYHPDELFRVEKFALQGNELSFQVRLLSADLAAGMRIEEKPVTVIWDREGTSLGKPPRYEPDMTAENLAVTLRGPIPPNSTSVILRLHVDGYPRAFLYELLLNGSNIIEQNNLKKNRTVGVHISRLAFGQQSFHITPRHEAFQPAVEPKVEPPMPEVVVQTLDRGKSEVAGIKLDNKQARQLLTFEMQADISSAAFSKGGRIEVMSQDGQTPLKFFRDRDVRIRLVPTTTGTGVLTFATSVDDFHNLTIPVDTDTQSDTRATLVAALRGADLPAPDGIHALPIIFDRLQPVISEHRLEMNPINISELNVMAAGPVVVKFKVTDNEGLGVKRVQAALVQRGMGETKPPEDGFVEYANPPESEISMELPLPGGMQPGSYAFKVFLEPVDKVDRLGKRTSLDLNVNVLKAPTAGGKPRTTFGNATNKQADIIKEIDKQKRLLPMPPPAGGAGS